MQIITGEGRNSFRTFPLSRIGKPEEILAVDIETTGFSPEQAQIYLIGCAWPEEGRWKRIQWLDDDGKSEADILTSFLLFARRYTVFLTYNGDRFDLPFLARRIVFNGLQGLPGADRFPEGRKSVDLFRILRPYQKLLSLPDLRQQTVERFVQTGRTEDSSGKDLIRVYQQFVGSAAAESAERTTAQAAVNNTESTSAQAAGNSTESTSAQTAGSSADQSSPEISGAAAPASAQTASRSVLREQLLSHNAADVDGLVAISDLLGVTDLFAASLTVYKAQANTHRDEEGEPVQELIMYARADDIPEEVRAGSVTVSRDGCYIAVNGNRVTIKVPIFNGKAYYFYANYKDYYYLPELDQAIHKSIASFVDPRRREQATARNCYTAKVSAFLPEWTREYEPFFKLDYDEKGAWFEFRDELKKDKAFFSAYATYVYHHVVAPGG